MGVTESTEESHLGDDTSHVTSANQSGKKQQQQRQQKPGRSSERRTLGSRDERVQRRLETVDTESSAEQQEVREAVALRRCKQVYTYM